MNRQFIIAEIKRIALKNNGKPPGRELFRRETGIPQYRWLGVHWVSWGEALAEAGFEPNALAVAFDKDFLLKSLATAVRDLRKIPTQAELMLYARGKGDFPNAKVFQRHFKTRIQTIRALKNYCERHTGMADILEICHPLLELEPKAAKVQKADKPIITGYVYLMRSGKYFKIGKSNHVGGREYQIALLLPESVNTIHTIATDDPEGIEAYWHNRFKRKRAKGEWFSLTSDDVKIFKTRKFM